MSKNIDYLKIPKKRIGVLIGKEGDTKKKLEERTGVDIKINSNTGEIKIDKSDADPFLAWKVRKVVKAIGRGFHPKKAVTLLDERKTLQIIDITNYANTRKSRDRLKGRVIGKEGRTRNILEQISGTDIAIFGKTISCIGPPKAVSITIEAIEMLLDGSPHGNAYNFLKDNVRSKGEIEYIRRK